MFEHLFQYFGLRENPFHVSPDPRFYFPTRAHDAALAELQFGVETRQGFLVLVGEAGTGKTTLINHFLNWLQMRRQSSSYVFHAVLKPIELLEFILHDFGIKCASREKGDLLAALQNFLIERHRVGDSPVVIIDEAQAISSRTLDHLRLLLNLETPGSKLLQIVLAGQPELEEKLRRPELRQLRQRIMFRCNLHPLSEEETNAYVKSRLVSAGAANGGNDVFDRESLELICMYARGIPRTVNLMCEHALIAGYTAQTKTIGAAIVRKVATDFDLTAAPVGDLGLGMSRFGRLVAGRPEVKADAAVEDLVEAVSASPMMAAAMPEAAPEPVAKVEVEAEAAPPVAEAVGAEAVGAEAAEPETERLADSKMEELLRGAYAAQRAKVAAAQALELAAMLEAEQAAATVEAPAAEVKEEMAAPAVAMEARSEAVTPEIVEMTEPVVAEESVAATATAEEPETEAETVLASAPVAEVVESEPNVVMMKAAEVVAPAEEAPLMEETSIEAVAMEETGEAEPVVAAAKVDGPLVEVLYEAPVMPPAVVEMPSKMAAMEPERAEGKKALAAAASAAFAAAAASVNAARREQKSRFGTTAMPQRNGGVDGKMVTAAKKVEIVTPAEKAFEVPLAASVAKPRRPVVTMAKPVAARKSAPKRRAAQGPGIADRFAAYWTGVATSFMKDWREFMGAHGPVRMMGNHASVVRLQQEVIVPITKWLKEPTTVKRKVR